MESLQSSKVKEYNMKLEIQKMNKHSNTLKTRMTDHSTTLKSELEKHKAKLNVVYANQTKKMEVLFAQSFVDSFKNATDQEPTDNAT